MRKASRKEEIQYQIQPTRTRRLRDTNQEKPWWLEIAGHTVYFCLF